MAKITKISEQKNNKERVSIYIDDAFCTGVRKRTFQAMNLVIGDEITCEELKEKESFFWKETYNESSWEKEKERINRIKQILNQKRPDLDVEIVGFGADSTDLIKEHAKEKGIPDLNILKENELVFKLEVTGTENMRVGEGYWVRPDKLEYASKHNEELVYTVLHYSNPTELIRFIKHIPGKTYQYCEKEIRGAIEHYCVFNDGDTEVLTLEDFLVEIKDI